MPHEPHANLLQPADTNAYIWRFIDLPKFLDMLVTGSLYFTRGDMFDDPYEGMPPDEYMEAVRRGQTNLGSVQHQTRMFHHYRADYFINCWHMSPHESAGMWKVYGGVDAGIAIKSNVQPATARVQRLEGAVLPGAHQLRPQSRLRPNESIQVLLVQASGIRPGAGSPGDDLADVGARVSAD